MTTRAQQLGKTADSQIAELAAVLSRAGASRLGERCPGREKLGDGTIATVAAHTANNYQRIADFIAATRGEQIPRVVPPRHADRGLDVLLDRLGSARDALTVIAQLDDAQLDSVPPAGTVKFADGQRTLAMVITSLLKHQRHHVRAIAAALT